MKEIIIPTEVQSVDVIFWSHSGGKDSQAGLAALIRNNLKAKIVIIHSDLGEMEWEPMHHWIESISHGLEVHVVKAKESFFEMAIRTKRLPSGRQQYCTDILKTEPIKEFIHNYMYKHGLITAINATGMRAEESKRRAKKKPFTLSQGPETSGMNMPKKHPTHIVYDWMPIFDYTALNVFAEIASCGQEPHGLYSMGFSRLSCVFCVNGRIGEHIKAAEMRPELALKFANLERQLGRSLHLKQVKGVKMPKYLDTYTNLPPELPVEAVL